MFRNLFDGPHLIIVLLVVLVLFGAKRMPDAARSLGRSMRIFKSEVEKMRNDEDPEKDPPAPTEPLSGRVVDQPKRTESTAPTDERH
jgi:sec-independent protein translocase protein TatA